VIPNLLPPNKLGIRASSNPFEAPYRRKLSAVCHTLPIQIALFAVQHGMHWVELGLPPANNSTAGLDEDLNRLGFWLDAGAQSNTDQGSDVAPPESDLATARHLGQRMAKETLQFVCGRAA
jgi:multimeric flavodoxin WrbA